MKKQDWLIAIVSGTLLGLLLAFFILSGHAFTSNARASQDADTDTILNLMLASHTKWQTAQGEATITWSGPDGTKQEYVQAFSISQPASARFESTQSLADLPNLWVSNGSEIFEANSFTKTYVASHLPRFALETGVIPTSRGGLEQETVYHHPFSLLIASPISEYLYPHWFAQGQADSVYQLLGEETILGRKVWRIDYTIRNNHVIAWVDQATGIILRYIQEVDGQQFVEVAFTAISFDATIDAQQFAIPSDYDRIEVPDEN